MNGVFLITGASTGIGAATARRRGKLDALLEELPAEKALAVARDVGRWEDQQRVVTADLALLQHDATTLRKDLPGQPAILANPRADDFATYQWLQAQKEGEADGRHLVEDGYFSRGGLGFISNGNLGHFVASEAERPGF